MTVAEPTSSMNLEDWHKRYLRQSQWTKDIRRHLFGKREPKSGERVLEVGVGTGAVASQVAADYQCRVVGIDIAFDSLCFARSLFHPCDCIQADARLLPFPNSAYTITYCHYVLMWVRHPVTVLAEMRRVTQSGGYVIALAESDYAARIDFPPPLDKIGRLQTQSLEGQGADIQMGRKLGHLFHETGFSEIEVGILGSQWCTRISQDIDETEWDALHSDIGNTVINEELANYRKLDAYARKKGERVLFIPTFYAVGKA